VTLEFSQDAVRRLAEIAWQVNERTENIGARRLHTVMEKLLEEISFDADKHQDATLVIDAVYVNDKLQNLSQDEDLARYVL
jgi:ATP-dependent HslUV protease ATP-binding subunit HslU